MTMRAVATRRSAQLRRLARAVLGEALAASFLATVLFFVGFGGLRALLSGPLSRGDMIVVYMIGAMWAQGGVYGDAQFGYPFGMDLRYYPTADHLLNAQAGLVTAITDNPFLGVNAMWAVSFPLTALAALWLMRLSGLRGPLAVLGSLAVTFVPFHWLRIEHTYLATTYSAVLGLCAALAIGSGRWSAEWHGTHRRRAIAVAIGVCAIIATSGVYYAAFAILFIGVAVLWRWATGARWRALLIDVAPAFTVIALLGLVLLPAMWFLRTTPALAPVADRFPFESIAYSGVLAFVLLPSALSGLPGMGWLRSFVTDAQTAATLGPTSGVMLPSNSGTVATTACLLFGAVGTAWLVRRHRRTSVTEPTPAHAVPTGLVVTLIVSAVLFYVPWGLNYLFAVAVTPQLRAWDRLTPVLLTLFVALGAVTARRMQAPKGGWVALGGAALGLVVLTLDAVWPYRTAVAAAAAPSRAEQAAGSAYAVQLNSAIPGRCGVLELPVVDYPEVGQLNGLGAYDHAWAALANPEKMWTFGANKETFDSGWLSDIDYSLDPSDVRSLAAGGFCAVHVDLRGYAPEEAPGVLSALGTALGDPVAEGHDGDWYAYAIPRWGAPISEKDIAAMEPDLQDFYAPVHVVPDGDGATPVADDWLLTAPEARLSLLTGDGRATFGSLAVPVTAASCAARDVTLTVTTVAGASTVSARVPAGGSATIEVRLEGQASHADLVVDSAGAACETDGSFVTVGEPARLP